MEWMKKHVDTVVILGAVVSSVVWMSGKFHEIEKEISIMKTELAVIKTVMLIKNILPSELAKGEQAQ